MKFYQFAAVCVVLFGCVAAAASQQEPAKTRDKESVYAQLQMEAEELIASRPLANDPEAATAGRVLFEEHCEECHGHDAQGTKKAPSLRAPEVQNAAPGAIFWILSNGVVRKGMPVWSKLPEPQRWQLVSYIKSLGTVAADSSVQSNPVGSTPNSPQP